jgi:hypothetical protein
MTATEFLQSKSIPEASYASNTESERRQMARAFGWASPKASATVVSYTPTQSKKGTGLYLKLEIDGARDGMFRLCDGDKLSEAARAVLTTLANDLADNI